MGHRGQERPALINLVVLDLVTKEQEQQQEEQEQEQRLWWLGTLSGLNERHQSITSVDRSTAP